MGFKIKNKQFIIRYHISENNYENLGYATGKNEQDAIEAYLGRAENRNETRQLTADECTVVDFGEKNECKSSKKSFNWFKKTS